MDGLFDLSGKKALVIGAGGIGGAIARGIAGAGADLVMADISPENLAAAEREIPGSRGVTVDINRRENIRELFQTVLEISGTLDILVNAAGIGRMAPAIDITEEDWNAVVNHFLSGVFWSSQEAARIMLPQKKGKILNIASMSGVVVTGGSGSAYAAAKAGLIQLTKALATEWIGDGVYVNALSPGMVRTALTAGMFDNNEEAVRKTSANIPLGRIARPEDMIGPALFLLSKASDYVVGQNLLVDGGYTAW
ncbi:MAG: SDR family oxidoreductase [Treponema sp.]|jgi:NAD(P)-dependent dehydrogenase (short-subunit alcohol dehydrogenase family)|nr:SDR family oxidoreductase [Treponema sp.]